MAISTSSASSVNSSYRIREEQTPGLLAAVPRLRRWLYTAAGLTSVFVAFVGVLLPGIPTTGPLLLASFLLAKGNPALQRQLLRCGLFRKYFEYLDGAVEMPMRARCWATAWMWISILISSGLLLSSGVGGWVLPAACVFAGVIGSVVIFRFRRSVSPVVTAPPVTSAQQRPWEEAECLAESEAILQLLHASAQETPDERSRVTKRSCLDSDGTGIAPPVN